MPQPDHIVKIPLPSQDTLADDILTYYGKCEHKLGLVPNVLRAYSVNEEKFRTFSAFYNQLMLDEETTRSLFSLAVDHNGRTWFSVAGIRSTEEGWAAATKYLRAAGYDQIYIMVKDEPKMAELDSVRQNCERLQKLGAKPWTALSVLVPASEHMLDWIDMPNLFTGAYSEEESRREVARWHEAHRRWIVASGNFTV